MGKHSTVAWICVVLCSIATCARTHQRGQLDNDTTFHQNRRSSPYKSSDGGNLTPRLRRFDNFIKPEQILISGVLVEDGYDMTDSEKWDSKREASERGFTEEHKKMLLDLHNVYRSNVTPPAGDMEHMEWDEELENLAQLWADHCEFEHGTPDNTEYSKGAYGQNLYLGHEPTGWNALWLWYDEYRHYDMKKLYCKPKEQCGHYVQMAWSNSNRLGCGATKCFIRNKKRWLIVCHYFGPAILGQQMYSIGTPCSLCPYPKGTLCRNNLCFSFDQCSRLPELCAEASCKLRCHNCGRLDKKNCKCQCADGFDGRDCSRACVDQHDRCGKNPGFYDKSTCSMNQNRTGTQYCRKMCGKCNGIEPGRTVSHKCCEGKVCKEGYVLDFEGKVCGCTPLCPGPTCDAAGARVGSADVLHGKRLWCVVTSLLLLYFLKNFKFICVEYPLRL